MAKKPSPASPVQAEEKSGGVEPKYLYALGVFLLACLWDKQFMHGGIFPN